MKPVRGAAAYLMLALAALVGGCSIWESREAVQPPEAAVDHYQKAVALEREGSYEQAQAEYRLAVKDNPDDSRAWVNLGRLYSRAGQESSATACWKKAVEVNPADAQAWNLLGGAAMRERDYNGALKDYRKAIENAPNDPDLYWNAAVACRSMKMDDAAETYYKRWLELTPNAAGEDAAEARQFLAGRAAARDLDARGNE